MAHKIGVTEKAAPADQRRWRETMESMRSGVQCDRDSLNDLVYRRITYNRCTSTQSGLFARARLRSRIPNLGSSEGIQNESFSSQIRMDHSPTCTRNPFALAVCPTPIPNLVHQIDKRPAVYLLIVSQPTLLVCPGAWTSGRTCQIQS